MRLDLSEIETMLIGHAQQAQADAQVRLAALEAEVARERAVVESSVPAAIQAVVRAHPLANVNLRAVAPRFDVSTKRGYLEWDAAPESTAPALRVVPKEVEPCAS